MPLKNIKDGSLNVPPVLIGISADPIGTAVINTLDADFSHPSVSKKAAYIKPQRALIP